MERYVCPPWFECRCVLGQPVSKSTMLNHRRAANQKRKKLGRGRFKWGPRVPNGSSELFNFECVESLEDHPSDDEDRPSAPLIPSQRRAPRSISENFENVTDTSAIARANCRFVVTPSATPLTFPYPHNEGSLETSALDRNDGDGSSIGPPRAHVSLSGDESPNDCVLEDVCAKSCSKGVNDLQTETNVQYDTPDTEREGSPNDSSDSYNSSHNQEVDGDHGTFSNMENTDISTALDENVCSDIGNEAFSRIPDLLPWLIQNQAWIELFYKHSLPEAFLDEACKLLKAPCKQWKTVVSNISHASGFQTELEKYPICKGHMAFAPLQSSDPIESCTVCGIPSPISSTPENTYHYLPIIPRLRAVVGKKRTFEQLYSYRNSRESHEDLMSDYFDGKGYQDLCDRYGGESALRDDIFLLASTDGFSPYKNRSYDLWSLAALNFNLSPDERYAPQNVLPLSFIPGPSQPKNLQSFIRPFVQEMLKGAQGITMKFYDDTKRLVRIHLTGFTGDQPAICKVAGLLGPNGKSPCRDCRIQGYYTNHYYFPSKILESPSKLRKIYDPRRLPLRSMSESHLTIATIQGSVGLQLRELQKSSGIREDSVLLRIPSMKPYRSFPHDIMHTFYNIQNELLRIIMGSYEDTFSLTKEQIVTLDEELESWKWGIAGQLGPKPRALSKFKDWKAAELKTFSLSYSVVLFDGFLPKQYLDGLRIFAEIVDICTRAEIQSKDVNSLQKLCVQFFEHFERCYVRYRKERADFCKSVFHILLHLASCMEYFGPLVGVSQYWLEGYIGWVGERNNAKTRPEKSMLKMHCSGRVSSFSTEGAFMRKKIDMQNY